MVNEACRLADRGVRSSLRMTCPSGSAVAEVSQIVARAVLTYEKRVHSINFGVNAAHSQPAGTSPCACTTTVVIITPPLVAGANG